MKSEGPYVDAGDVTAGFDAAAAGREMYELARELYPICRSLTGDGVRQTLARLSVQIPLQIHEVATGTQVFDWTIPREWNIREAYVANTRGERVIDFKRSNLHIIGHSIPVRARMPLADLRAHLHTLPEHPDWLPYRTSYYRDMWGFCLSQRQLEALEDGDYDVVIDATLKDGHLTYGEYFIPGLTEDEVLIFTHTCHPSLANDNLSGLALATFLAQRLAGRRLRYSYRFVFAPTTLGSITWLARNEERLGQIKHGLVVAVVGDPGRLTYKKSSHGDAEIDRIATHVLKTGGRDYDILEFTPWGYDERQFGSPGIHLPVGRLTRTPNGCYPEYHTSADDLSLIRPEALGESLAVYLRVVNVLEHNRVYRNLSPKGEPQLGRRGVYQRMGGHHDIEQRQWAILWLLNQSIGGPTLLDIAEKAGVTFEQMLAVAHDLVAAGLLAPMDSTR